MRHQVISVSLLKFVSKPPGEIQPLRSALGHTGFIRKNSWDSRSEICSEMLVVFLMGCFYKSLMYLWLQNIYIGKTCHPAGGCSCFLMDYQEFVSVLRPLGNRNPRKILYANGFFRFRKQLQKQQ